MKLEKRRGRGGEEAGKKKNAMRTSTPRARRDAIGSRTRTTSAEWGLQPVPSGKSSGKNVYCSLTFFSFYKGAGGGTLGGDERPLRSAKTPLRSAAWGCDERARCVYVVCVCVCVCRKRYTCRREMSGIWGNECIFKLMCKKYR